MNALLLALALVAGLSGSAGADAQACPLYSNSARPTKLRTCDRPLSRLCRRICHRFPDIAVCKACGQPGGGCLPPIPTPEQCCAAGFPVEGCCPAP